MSRIADNLGLQPPFIQTGGLDSLDALINIYNNSSDDVKNLLTRECTILLQCCYCCNFFRYPFDYLTHKRVYCRASCSTTASAFSAMAVDFAEKALGEIRNGNQNKKEAASPQQKNRGEVGTSSGTKTSSQPPKRAKVILKRTNLINLVNKRMKHYAVSLPNSKHKLELHTPSRVSRDVAATTFVEGQQVMESIPHALVTTDIIRPGQVPILIPQDDSSRCREMNLLDHKDDSSKNGVARKLGTEELKILERMGKYQTLMVDLSLLTCSHSDCKEKQPFSSLFTFAYHLTVKHNHRATSNKRIPCYLCDFESETYTTLIEHLKNAHEQYYQEYVTARSTSEELKRGRKGKQSKAILMGERNLNPLSVDSLGKEESFDGSEGIGYDSVPVLEPMTNMEAENIELAVKDSVDYIIAVICGEVEKAPVLEDSKYELNTQFLRNEPSSRPQLRPEKRTYLNHEKTGQLTKLGTSVSKKKKHGPIRLRIARKRIVGNMPTGRVAGPSRISHGSDEEGKHETELPKKSGQERKPKPKACQIAKNDIEKDEQSGNSDEAKDGRKQRPSRQRLISNKSIKVAFICYSNVVTGNHELDGSAARSPIALSSAGPSSTGAESTRDIMTKKTCRLQYTPRARRMKYGDDLLSNINEEEIASTSSKDAKRQTASDSANIASGDGRSASQSRRKQDLSTIHENNEVMIVRYPNGEAPLQKDLAQIPVYLTAKQRDLFLSLIHSTSSSGDGASSAHKRMQCGDIIANIPEYEASTKYISKA
ncbi:zinc finger protein [Loa loa]|uniref:Zinc finger protein n=1 Tax=Loa loa TaxID=7209 RepID=A0A1S0UE02_LOALO|nr:zinc finger protein [Loa loa]EJD73661.1 zinc finger protein [Loa loa]